MVELRKAVLRLIGGLVAVALEIDFLGVRERASPVREVNFLGRLLASELGFTDLVFLLLHLRTLLALLIPLLIRVFLVLRTLSLGVIMCLLGYNPPGSRIGARRTFSE